VGWWSYPPPDAVKPQWRVGRVRARGRFPNAACNAAYSAYSASNRKAPQMIQPGTPCHARMRAGKNAPLNRPTRSEATFRGRSEAIEDGRRDDTSARACWACWAISAISLMGIKKRSLRSSLRPRSGAVMTL
jgi:hypothetical protein